MDKRILDVCDGILSHLEKDEVKYPLFKGPAISALPPEQIDEYNSVISDPCDLALVRVRLDSGSYSTFEAFRDDGAYFC
jgi:hypothetical protein